MAQTEPEENLGNSNTTVIWQDNNNEYGRRPSQIILYRLDKNTNEPIGEPFSLSVDNNWSIIFESDVDDYNWDVATIPYYTATVSIEESTIVITCTYNPNNTEEPITEETDEDEEDVDEEVGRVEYYINITDEPLEDLNNVNIKLSKKKENGQAIDNISFISSSKLQELESELQQMIINYRSYIEEQLEDVIGSINRSEYPFPYADQSGELVKDNETITFEQVKEAVEGNPNAETPLFKQNSTAQYTNQRWTNWGEITNVTKDSSHIHFLTYQTEGGIVYTNNTEERLRLRIKLSTETDSNVYANKSQNEVVHMDNIDKLGLDYTDFILDSNEKVYVLCDFDNQDNGLSLDYIVDVVSYINAIFDKAYPVGSIYITTINESPSLFGGEWEKVGQGRTLIGDGTFTDSKGSQKTFALNESQSGTYEHVLTENEMPSHNHTTNTHKHNISPHGHTISPHSHQLTPEAVWSNGSGKHGAYTQTPNRSTFKRWTQPSATLYTNNVGLSTDSPKVTVNNKGGGSPHNNMQPYFVVSIWKRVH